MADPTLADMLARYAEPEPYPYGKPRFPNVDPRAYFDAPTQRRYADEPYDPHNISPGLLMGALAAIRPGSAAGSMRPFNPRAPEAPLPKRPEAATSDSGWGQHLYEALLGRVRDPKFPHEPAAPGSGSPYQSPLFWLGSGAGAYGSYKLWGLDKEPWLWEESEKEKLARTQGTPEYAEAQRRENNSASWAGDTIARGEDQATARRLGLNHDFAQRSMLPWRDAAPYTDEMMARLAPYRLPGGVGNAPY